MTETKYDKQARKFLKSTGATLSLKLIAHDKYFPNDEATRDIYQVTLTRAGRGFTFTFGQSLANSQKYHDTASNCRRIPGKPPTNYEVLSSLDPYVPETFEEFAGDYGYDPDSRAAEKTYNEMQRHKMNLERLFTNEELELLANIT